MVVKVKLTKTHYVHVLTYNVLMHNEYMLIKTLNETKTRSSFSP